MLSHQAATLAASASKGWFRVHNLAIAAEAAIHLLASSPYATGVVLDTQLGWTVQNLSLWSNQNHPDLWATPLLSVPLFPKMKGQDTDPVFILVCFIYNIYSSYRTRFLTKDIEQQNHAEAETWALPPAAGTAPTGQAGPSSAGRDAGVPVRRGSSWGRSSTREALHALQVLRHDIGPIPPTRLAAARLCPGVAKQAFVCKGVLLAVTL